MAGKPSVLVKRLLTTQAQGGELMCKKRFVTGVVLGMGLALAASSIEAREQRFRAHFAGTDTFKGDFSFTGGGSVDYFTIAGNSTLGNYTAQGVFEGQPTGNTCPLPDGGSGVEFAAVDEVFVLSFTATGEQ